MNLNVVISIIGFIALVLVIEHSIKSRIDRTENNDVILWYYNREGERVFTFLFHFN